MFKKRFTNLALLLMAYNVLVYHVYPVCRMMQTKNPLLAKFILYSNKSNSSGSRKDVFYLTTHSTHSVSYLASDI